MDHQTNSMSCKYLINLLHISQEYNLLVHLYFGSDRRHNFLPCFYFLVRSYVHDLANYSQN